MPLLMAGRYTQPFHTSPPFEVDIIAKSYALSLNPHDQDLFLGRASLRIASGALTSTFGHSWSSGFPVFGLPSLSGVKESTLLRLGTAHPAGDAAGGARGQQHGRQAESLNLHATSR